MSTIKEKIILNIVNFLGEELKCESLSSTSKDKIQHAIENLCQAYNVSSSDIHLVDLKNFYECFSKIGEEEDEKNREPTQEEKDLAEKLKNEGNDLMKQDLYEEALKKYTEAIRLNDKNAVYYCNRAAAYNKLKNVAFAINDCKKAIEIDPNYSRPYGRMGLIYANSNEHSKAKECYKKASELDPSNESFKLNYKVADEMLKKQCFDTLHGFAENIDVRSLLTYPDFRDLAQRMIFDNPSAQDLISNMFDGINRSTGNNNFQQGGGEETNPEAPNNPIRAQQIFDQILNSNPVFFEQITRSLNNNRNGNSNN